MNLLEQSPVEAYSCLSRLTHQKIICRFWDPKGSESPPLEPILSQLNLVVHVTPC